MKIFEPIYKTMMKWAANDKAFYFLNFVSFIEAIFFPIPPDVMLVPMSMTKPRKVWLYAISTGVFSIIGGLIGYYIGLYFKEFVEFYIMHWGYAGKWDSLREWIEHYDILVIFVAGFSPIPFKLFTLSAGTMHLNFISFILVSFISRTLRFIIVAKIAVWGEKKYADKIQKNIEIVGWIILILLAILCLAL